MGRKARATAPPADEPVERPVFAARLWKGVFPYGKDGKPLQLAVVDDEGHIVEQGDAVSGAAWDAALEVYWQHLRDLGVMRSYGATPPKKNPAH